MSSYLKYMFMFIVVQIIFWCNRTVNAIVQFDNFELLDYKISPFNIKSHNTRRRRSIIVDHQFDFVFNFFTHGKNITLELNKDEDVISEDSLIEIEGKKILLQNEVQLVKGKVKGYDSSVVYGSVQNGIFKGSVYLNGMMSKYSPTESFHIEPSGNYIEDPGHHHSIIYSDSEVKRTKRSAPIKNNDKEEHFCGMNDPLVNSYMSKMYQQPNFNYEKTYDNPFFEKYSNDKSNDSKKTGANSRVCNLYLQSDTFLWDYVIRLPHIKGDKKLAIKEISSILTQHVQSAQAIYRRTVFKDFSGSLEYHGVNFRVDRVLINVTEHDCAVRPDPLRKPGGSPTAMPQGTKVGSYADSNPFCMRHMDVTNFLNLNAYQEHDNFCLAYVFTYRDFAGGTLGLAWVAQLGGSGGICEKHRVMREGSKHVRKSLNTGIVTLLNYGAKVASKVSQLTFAHEIGHNFGAKHDDDHQTSTPSCLPPPNDPRGNYIMFASATSGTKNNNNQFSLCSLDSIARLVDRVLSSENNCFLKSDGPFCGNQLTEVGEQCDCGFTPDDCQDECCYPNDSKYPCKLRKFVRNTANSTAVQCSPTAGECCTNGCQYRATHDMCKPAGECHEASYCTGTNVTCPTPKPFPDGTACQNHTKVCKRGHCSGSICESIPGWQECSLTRDGDVTPEKMCYVACQLGQSSNDTGLIAPYKNASAQKTSSQLSNACISTFDLERNANLRAEYPELVTQLLRNDKGIQFKPGAPCDNYRGYCDFFLQCRLIDAQGPLARLRDLLFDTRLWIRVKRWITLNWWAIILLCVVVIVCMLVFVRLFGFSHPSSSYRPGMTPIVGDSAPNGPNRSRRIPVRVNGKTKHFVELHQLAKASRGSRVRPRGPRSNAQISSQLSVLNRSLSVEEHQSEGPGEDAIPEVQSSAHVEHHAMPSSVVELEARNRPHAEAVTRSVAPLPDLILIRAAPNQADRLPRAGTSGDIAGGARRGKPHSSKASKGQHKNKKHEQRHASSQDNGQQRAGGGRRSAKRCAGNADAQRQVILAQLDRQVSGQSDVPLTPQSAPPLTTLDMMTSASQLANRRVAMAVAGQQQPTRRQGSNPSAGTSAPRPVSQFYIQPPKSKDRPPAYCEI